ncbi:50S ribosome-binding GTPase [Rossellomorea aquimaris]|uniref:GTPase n=1 Tax=Rossellomorea aquimaris TaxID=189382 RepID=UPI001CD224AB|nr:GTPase [Rossellomorea aquimaris]MCA1056973.1 50S ribosome-binding GTPase [Rossellomorea aquimaris]
MVKFDDKEFDKAYEEEINSVNEQLKKEILFAMIGDVNSGKSSTINKLIGDEVASVGSKPGETTNVKKYKYKDKIIFADTPGLNDINRENSEETFKFFKEADVILFFLNAAGTVFSEGEKKYFEKISKVNKEIIFVLNKIDAAEDIPNLVKYIRDNTGNNYKVTPISSKTGENIDLLRSTILDILMLKKKDILFAKHVREKSSIANRWILGASTSAAAIGAYPLLESDTKPLTVIQVGLMVKLAALYEKPITKDRAKELVIATMTGKIGKSIFKKALNKIPGAKSVLGAGVAGSVTLGLGYGIKYAYENNIELDAELLKSLSKVFEKENVKG